MRATIHSYEWLDGLVDFIEQELLDDSEESVVDVNPLRAGVARLCLAGVGAAGRPMPAGVVAAESSDKLLDEYIEQVLARRRTAPQWKGDVLPVPHPGLESAYVRLANRPYQKPAQPHPRQPSKMALAKERAAAGICRLEGCLCAMDFLSILFARQAPQFVPKGMAKGLRAELMRRRQIYQAEYVRLVLIGGDAQEMEQLRQELYDQAYGPDKCVMPLLQENRFTLNCYHSSDEEQFRAELSALCGR